MSPVAFYLVLVSATLLFVAAHIKIYRVKYNISSDDCPEKIKELYFRKHPGVKWILNMVNSLDKVDKHMKDFALYLKDTEVFKEREFSSIYAFPVMWVLSSGETILRNAYKKLNSISVRKADHIIRKYGTNAATEKYFGSFIEDFYYITFVIDEIKERIEKKDGIDLSHEVLTSCKERAHNIRIKYAA